MSYPTYSQVKSLARSLAEGKNIKDRRRDGEELCRILGRPETRQRLVVEASGRPEGLREMWRLLTNYVIAGLHSINSKRSKLLPDDVRILRRFMEICITSTEGFENELSTGKLTKKEVRAVIQFVLDLLDEVDDGKFDNAEIEVVLLELLSQICIAREFVVHLRPQTDMRIILEVAERRIEEDKPSTTVLVAQIVHRLLATAASLYISLDNLLPGYVKVVASWCRSKHGMHDCTLAELEHVIGGLAVLLKSNPEQAIGPMTRHGAIVLKFVKRRYVQPALRRNNKEREALNDYIVSHIHVNQVAGRLQGLHPGDLGDLGPATLTKRHLGAILDVAVQICTVEEIKDTLKSSRNNKTDFPLNKPIHKQQLQVTARLLACLQRLVIADAEWNENEQSVVQHDGEQTPSDRLLAKLPQHRRPDREYLDLSLSNTQDSYDIDAYASSPFCELVLKPLFAAGNKVSQDCPAGEESLRDAEGTLSLPIISTLASEPVTTSDSAIIPLLQLICAAVEIFPAGDCWVSACVQGRWHRHGAVPGGAIGPITLLAGSPDDLAAIIFVVGGILITQGTSGGDEEIQKWALVTLKKLTEASYMMINMYKEKVDMLFTLEVAWQKVWSSLFQSNVRYCVATKVLRGKDDRPTVGSLVLALLESIIRNFCTCPALRWSALPATTQSSFPYRQQDSLWSLPVFADACAKLSSECFELIYTAIYATGLVEGHLDLVCQITVDAVGKFHCDVDAGCVRRCKFLEFCVHAFDSGVDELAIPALAACMAMLVHGGDTLAPSVHKSEILLSIDSVINSRDNKHYHVSDFLERCTDGSSKGTSTFALLWDASPLSKLSQFDILASILDEVSLDFAAVKSITLKHGISAAEKVRSADFVSIKVANALIDSLTAHFRTQFNFEPADELHNDTDSGAIFDATLQRGMLATKVLLSVVLSLSAEHNILHLDAIGAHLAKFGKLLNFGMKQLCKNNADFLSVFLYLGQIASGLAEFIASSHSVLPQSMKTFADNLYMTVRELVVWDDMSVDDNAAMVTDRTEPRRIEAYPSGDFLEIDETESLPGKRSAPNKEVFRRKRRKILGSDNTRQLVVPSRQALFLSSSLLLTLNPTIKTCEQVGRKLLRVRELSLIDHADSSVDAFGGVVASFLIIRPSVFLHQAALNTPCNTRDASMSVASLLCKIIDGTRSVVPPDSCFFPFGYDACASIVQMCESPLRKCPLTTDEASQITRLLKGLEDDSERRHFGVRPTMRALRLRAATASFLSGGEKLHDELDSAFPGTFVLPSLSDADGLVRRQASFAVAAALEMMGDEDRVVESVRKYILPLTRNPEFVDEEYKVWCAVKDVSYNSDPTRIQFWQDAKLAVAWDALNCLSTIAIACCLTNEEHSRRIMFELIELSASRPELRCVCFQWFDTMANGLGFTSAEQLVESLTEDILHRWIGTQEYKLADIPMLLAAPGLMRYCLDSGRSLASHVDEHCAIDCAEIQTQIVANFIRRWNRSIIPRVMACILSHMVMDSVTRDGRRSFLGHPYTQEICCVYDNAFNDELVKSILKKYLPDILAFQMVLSCGNDFHQQVANEIAMLLNGLLMEHTVREEGQKRATAALRRFLETIGSSKLIDGHQDVFKKMHGAMSKFVATYGADGENIFLRVGTNTPELLLVSLYHLSCAHAPSHLQKKYEAVDFVCGVLSNTLNDCKGTENVDFVFCIQLLSILLFQAKFESIHCRILSTIREIVTVALFKSKTSHLVAAAIKRVAKELLAVSMHLHETSQMIVLAQWDDISKTANRAYRLSLGLYVGLTSLPSDDAWDWVDRSGSEAATYSLSEVLAKDSHQVDADHLLKLRETYEIIKLLIEGESERSLFLDQNDFIGAASPYKVDQRQINTLAAVKTYYAAQVLVQEFLQRNALDTISNWTWLNDASDEGSMSTTPVSPIRQRILIAELDKLKDWLKLGLGDGEASHFVKEDLVRRLGSYCETRYPDIIRLAAGRCLGELALDRIVLQTPGSELRASSDVSTAPQGIWDGNEYSKARCVVAALRSLHSTDQRTAMIALDTVKLLLAQLDLGLYERHVKNAQSLALLRSFPTKTSRELANSFLLSRFEQQRVFDAACKIAQSSLSKDLEWCWDTNLWTNVADVSFEEWICCIVPAIIICCHDKLTLSNSSASFFSLLVRLCATVAEVAEMAFHALLLELLINDDFDLQQTSTPVQRDTWIGSPNGHFNMKISSAFTVVFAAAVGTDASDKLRDKRTLILLLDLIDFLRQLTLHRFKESKSHARNKMKKIKDGNERPTHPSGWHGIPYGTVLRIDGLLAAGACLCANRLVSAMFYAELYADNRLGGPSRAFAFLSSESQTPSFNNSSSSEISGFGRTLTEGTRNKRVEEIVSDEEIMRYMTVLKDGMAGLLEKESARAISSLQSNFLIRQGHAFSLIGLNTVTEENALIQLQQLEYIQVGRPGWGESSTVSAARCLDALGLAGTVQHYIQGISVDRSHELHSSSSDVSQLREKWFENAIYRMSWDDTIFNADVDAMMPQRTPPPEFSGHNSTDVGFHESLVQAIDFFSQDDVGQTQASLSRSQKLIIDLLPAISNREVRIEKLGWSLERLGSLCKIMDILDCSGDLENNLKMLDQKVRHLEASPDHESSTLNVAPCGTRFMDSITELLLRSLYRRELSKGNDQNAQVVLKQLAHHLWKQCSFEYRNPLQEMASVALQRLFIVVRASPSHDYDITKLRLQESRILEAKGDITGAIRHATQVVRLLKEVSSQCDEIYGEALITCGEWMAKYKVKPGNAILENFFEPGSVVAQKAYEKAQDEKTLHRLTASYLALGRLTCDLFEAVRVRMNSAEWRDQEQRLDYQENELKECENLLKEAEKNLKEKSSKKDKALLDNEITNNKIYKAKLRKEVDKLKAERMVIEISKERYRKIALKSISNALQVACVRDSSPMEKYVYMLFSLWFSTSNVDSSVTIDDVLPDFERIPSFRFVPLANQFVARIGCVDLSSTSDASNDSLTNLISRMCLEHPYHCLQYIVYLSHADENGSPKSNAAKYFQAQLRNDAKTFRLLGNYELLVHAYIHLAEAAVDKTKNFRGANVPFSKIGKPMERLDSCLEGAPVEDRPCILTKLPILRPVAKYGDLREDSSTDLILGFEREFTIAEGGMNVPKIVKCVGTRQERYKQLVKGKDEIRQDAVMQQMFCYINQLLQRRQELPEVQREGDDGVLRKPLKLVTYNIVPLSPLCGVLEWVDKTVAFNDFIVDSAKSKTPGAHSRYYPGEWPSQYCRGYLEKETENKLKAFTEILRHHSPCFRYFFVEKFGHRMDEWHSARLRYARSVAVNSIVGHVLGIGDRHSSNILVHQTTAELVHIDFGIVFEQGRLLRTPEKVPFRLTQNIVDGLGPTGVDGVFTDTAETTMLVLKHNSTALLTILTSIAADPLYMWTLSPVKARAKQLVREKSDDDEPFEDDDNPDDFNCKSTEPTVDVLKAKHDKEMTDEAMNDAKRNDQATHIIAKVQQKLQGYEDGTSGEQQGVKGQIQLLINQAREIDNLANMYSGWAPWL
ncbi:hypothetical protein MPSEU_000213400 [Mayamaea pseudoterrestris]|nr:hypothetical protein MPSEU_000213400 [Mayamaea pseudoterrestris]